MGQLHGWCILPLVCRTLTLGHENRIVTVVGATGPSSVARKMHVRQRRRRRAASARSPTLPHPTVLPPLAAKPHAYVVRPHWTRP